MIQKILISLILLSLFIIGCNVSSVEEQKEYSFTHSDDLTFSTNRNGVITIEYNGVILTRLGFALSGNISGEKRIVTSEDFNWTWSKFNYSYLQEEFNETLNESVNISYDVKVFTAYNNVPMFNWTQEWIFNPLKAAKIKHIITNDLGVPIYNTKLWYINTIEEGKIIRFNRTRYWLNKTFPIHKKGNFNDNLPRLKFFGTLEFSYEDIINDGFDITDIYIGKGDIIGHPNVAIVGLGITKGNRVFPDGYTLVVDPAVTSYLSPDCASATKWSNPNNIMTSNNAHATETTVGHMFNASCYGFEDVDIPSGSLIVGVEVSYEGKSGECGM